VYSPVIITEVFKNKTVRRVKLKSPVLNKLIYRGLRFSFATTILFYKLTLDK